MTEYIQQLHQLGQSLWYDNISRRELENGKLAGLISHGDIRGVTSNPSIFHNAIGKTRDYDSALKPMAWAGWTADQIFNQLAIEDIRAAADLFRPLYDQTKGGDGYVSLEVSPTLAHDTEATLADAKRLWAEVKRPNLMIKIPATLEGIPAIRDAIAAGLNINVTLIFSLERYAAVMEAYLSGLELRVKAGLPVDGIASVASFFVSRVDTMVDARLQEMIKTGQQAEKAEKLLGRAAIDNAKLAYELFKNIFGTPRFDALKKAGARPQRPLWASTSTKNPAYRDVIYLDELIGPETVNTVPPQTLESFRDHGTAHLTLSEGLASAHRELDELEALGISMKQVTQQLEIDGVDSFAKAFAAMMETIEERRLEAVAELGPLSKRVVEGVKKLDAEKAIQRMFEKDASFWTSDPAGQAEVVKRLGWLMAPESGRSIIPEVTAFAKEIVQEGFTHALLLGMGGSSLAPEVMRLCFGLLKIGEQTALDLAILDSTDPGQVLDAARRSPIEKTLYIVSSKSGGTAEVNAYLDYFWAAATQKLGGRAGDHFVAITDPGTSLESMAKGKGFRKIFTAEPTVGGRYSALIAFGLVPAGLMGIDLDKFLARAEAMKEQCQPGVPAARNPGLVLGAVMGQAARVGCDKLTILTDDENSSMGSWMEQLVAESSGKEGKGIVPVDIEPLASPAQYSKDRLFVYLRLNGQKDILAKELLAAGHPVLTLQMESAYDLAAEFYRWEVGTTIACALLGVNAFDQPDVQDNKNRTVKKITDFKAAGHFEESPTIWQGDGIKIYGLDFPGLKTCTDARSVVSTFMKLVKEGDYVAINAYLPRNAATLAELQGLRAVVLGKTNCATTLGFGPRFLHSTGQLHKGGANNGVFIQITADPETDVEIPGQGIHFGDLERAQALGDLEALLNRNRRAIRIHLPAWQRIKDLM